MNCMYCNCVIPEERAEWLIAERRAATCVGCSTEQPRLVLMDYAHKTAGVAVVVPRGDEGKALRYFRRSR